MDNGGNHPKRYAVIPSGSSSSNVLLSRFNYIHEDGMRIIYATLFGCFIFAGSKACYAQITSWENSPLNYKNSELNYNNSSMKWENSPLNWDNSSLNINSNTGVYDNSGNRYGYETIAPSGTKNYYDNSGNRIGYSK